MSNIQSVEHLLAPHLKRVCEIVGIPSEIANSPKEAINAVIATLSDVALKDVAALCEQLERDDRATLITVYSIAAQVSIAHYIEQSPENVEKVLSLTRDQIDAVAKGRTAFAKLLGNMPAEAFERFLPPTEAVAGMLSQQPKIAFAPFVALAANAMEVDAIDDNDLRDIAGALAVFGVETAAPESAQPETRVSKPNLRLVSDEATGAVSPVSEKQDTDEAKSATERAPAPDAEVTT